MCVCNCIDLLHAVLTLQRNLNRLSVTHKELEEMLEEERSQKEQYKNMNNNIEDERRLLDRTVEKLQREVSAFNCGALTLTLTNPHRILLLSRTKG